MSELGCCVTVINRACCVVMYLQEQGQHMLCCVCPKADEGPC